MTQTPSTASIIRRHCRPMLPIPTDEPARIVQLPGIRAVLFDVYGTLFVSASGEVGTVLPTAPAAAFSETLHAVGLPPGIDGARGVAALAEAIHRSHQASKASGVAYPEVDILDIWHRTLVEVGIVDPGGARLPDGLLRRMAVEYEARTNPVWPMPGAESVLQQLHQSGRRLGIISNAQFYTSELFVALLGRSLTELAIAEDMQYYSYRYGEAKPGETMYRAAAEALASEGIAAREVLYVGNDLLNDCTPAAAVGFRTALFAGDARSLRLREADPRVARTKPDLVIHDLKEILEALESAGGR